MPNKLSEHFTEEELIVSQTAARHGIDNSPSPAIQTNLVRLAGILEEVRALLGGLPVLVSSGYRCLKLNQAIGGSKTSAHMEGLAVDFTAPAFGSPLEVARRIAASGIEYDQLIYEYGNWVHIGLAREGATRRNEQLSIFRGTGYIKGIMASPA